MAKRKELSKELLELKKEITDGKLVVGFKTVLKQLQADALNRVYLAQNCPADTKAELERFLGLGKTPLVVLGMDNEELGAFCKKNFFISVLGVKKK